MHAAPVSGGLDAIVCNNWVGDTSGVDRLDVWITSGGGCYCATAGCGTSGGGGYESVGECFAVGVAKLEIGLAATFGALLFLVCVVVGVLARHRFTEEVSRKRHIKVVGSHQFAFFCLTASTHDLDVTK